MTIYEKKEKLRKEFKILQSEYLNTDNFKEYLRLREKEQKVYDKFLFFKNYLEVERKFKG